jgi:hypothetical protein
MMNQTEALRCAVRSLEDTKAFLRVALAPENIAPPGRPLGRHEQLSSLLSRVERLQHEIARAGYFEVEQVDGALRAADAERVKAQEAVRALSAAMRGHTSNRAAEDAAWQAFRDLQQALARLARALGLPPLSRRVTAPSTNAVAPPGAPGTAPPGGRLLLLPRPPGSMITGSLWELSLWF